jgi:hypothetical protein
MVHPSRHGRFWLVACLLAALVAGCGGPSDMVLPAPTGPTSTAAEPEPTAPLVDIARASDEFNDSATLSDWTVMQGVLADGTPGNVDIGRSSDGMLTMVPSRSWWVNGTRGFFVYKRVAGDFAVTVRIRASGRGTPSPTVNWSLAGLLLRAPADPNESEQWIGYTVGFVDGPIVERKTTKSSRSELRLISVQPGWIELRAVRTGSLIMVLRRQAGQAWILDAVYERPELPDALQVGIDAQSGYDSNRADLIAQADWIHITGTGIPAGAAETVRGQLTHAVSRDDGNTLTAKDTDLVRTALLPFVTAIP